MSVFFILAILAFVSFCIAAIIKISWRESVVGILFMFPMPLTEIVGSHMPMFFCDFVPLIIFILYSVRNKISFKQDKYIKLCFILFLFLPIISTIYSQIAWTSPNLRYFLYIFRRFNLFILIILASQLSDDFSPVKLMNSAAIFWLFISFLGLLNYSGLYTLPSYIEKTDELTPGESVFQNYRLVRGFLSYNRGALGLYGSTFILFSFGSLLFKKVYNNSKILRIIYVLIIITSLINIIFSGTRTGLFVVCFVLFLLFVQHSLVSKKLSFAAILIFLTMSCIGAYAFTRLSNNRFSTMGTDNSFESRLVVQEIVLSSSVENPYIFLFGNGVRPFDKMNHLGFVHPHSEFFEILFLTGWLSLILYLVLLYWFTRSFFKSQNSDKYIYLSVLLSGTIFAFMIGHFLIFEPRLSSFGAFIFFVYSLYLYQTKKESIES